MSKHTDTPWAAQGPYIEANNETICQCFQFSGGREASLSNAAFIVKAVNNHDALVAALRDCRGFTAWQDAQIDAVLAAVEAA